MSSVSAEEDEAQQIAEPEPEKETPTKLGPENGEQKEKNGEKEDTEQTAENGDQKQQEPTENPVADANGDGDEGRIAVSPEEAEQQQMEFGTRQSALVPHEEEGIPVSDEEDNADQQQQDEMSAEAKAKPAVVDDLSVAKEISEYMKVNRINPGELDTLDDMWAICDAISAAHSGLPDSLLREAFLLVLEGFQSYAKTNPWLRKQLDHLSRMWKRCMVSGTKYNRPTKFVCAPASETISAPTAAVTADEQDIHGKKGESREQQSEQQQSHETATSGKAAPQPPDAATMSASKLRRQRRQRDKRKRALAVMMGVGEMLTQARRKFATEEGELDIDEDEYGNFSIGGMELSFENWGQLNQIKDAGIVRSTVQPPKRWKRGGGQANKQRMGPKTAMASIAVDETPNLPTIEEGKHSNGTPKGQKDETIGQRHQQIDMAREYPTVAEVEMEGMEPMPMSKKDRKAMEREAKQKRREEKDEGEISTTDDEATSSSEESSSEDEGGGHHRHKRRKLGIPTKMTTAEAAATMGTPQERRRARREEERKQGASSAQNLQVLLRKCFELRSRIVGKLSIGQKAMFRDLLSKSIAGTLQPAQQQQGQLQDLINSFVGE